MKKKDALEDLWRNLEENPVPDNVEARQKKLAALMTKLPDAAGAPIAAGASKGAAAGWGRTALRYAWVPLAAAACIAAVVLLRTPSQPAPGADSTLLALNPAPELLAEATHAASASPATSASSAVSKTTPICIQTPEKTAICMQNHPILHTDNATTASHVQNTPDSHMSAAPKAEPASTAPTPDPFAESPAPRRHRRTLALSLFAAGDAGSSATAQIIDFKRLAANPGEYLGTLFDQYCYDSNPYSPTVESSATFGSALNKIYMHHDMPLNIGASLAYSITNRLALESGITYSYLHSSINQNETNYDRHLHYLGVPLALQYKVLDRPKFSAYVSGGGSVAYCLGGKLVKPGVITVEINDHPVQTALTASAGANYRIAGPFSIFGEVAFNRFFNDGTGLETYYSQNPYAPSFKAGARITINK